ncbi:MAG: Rieske 2Fe-2S domain-containing protein [Proteobacteria bacterium]|nr:Rieske 2Fe-2S domain-containing protein [Pseudomonadota bacterium]
MIAPGTLLARVSEIADPGALVVKIDAADVWGSVLLTRCSGEVAAFHNRCSHAGYPLQRANGRVLVQHGRYIVCGAHGASYELRTGACAGGPCNGAALTPIAIAIEDGEIRAV